MADSRFFRRAGPFTLAALAEAAGADLADPADADASISDVAPLQAAGPAELTFIDNRKYLDALAQTGAGACLARPGDAERVPAATRVLTTPEPYRAYAVIAAMFYPRVVPEPAIHPSAHIDPAAVLAADVRVDAGAVVEAGAEIGPRSWIGASAVIGTGVVVGADATIGAHVTLQYAVVGERVILHPGVRVGQDGFGFAPGARHQKVPQLGRVLIGDDVEVGANTCIDRGTGPDTVVSDGCKIDNFVQIAHNVRLGRHCLLAAHVGISGSTEIGDYVMIGGQAGFAGHLRVGDGARIAAQAGVMRDVPAKASVGGSPAQPMRDFLRGVAVLERLGSKKGT